MPMRYEAAAKTRFVLPKLPLDWSLWVRKCVVIAARFVIRNAVVDAAIVIANLQLQEELRRETKLLTGVLKLKSRRMFD